MHYILKTYIAYISKTPTPTDIYTLSLHDALPISSAVKTGDITSVLFHCWQSSADCSCCCSSARAIRDRKSTRLNSSHLGISYAVFCLKKKNKPRDLSIA